VHLVVCQEFEPRVVFDPVIALGMASDEQEGNADNRSYLTRVSKKVSHSRNPGESQSSEGLKLLDSGFLRNDIPCFERFLRHALSLPASGVIITYKGLPNSQFRPIQIFSMAP